MDQDFVLVHNLLKYAYQALRPDMLMLPGPYGPGSKKENKHASFQAVRPGKMLLQLRPYGLSCNTGPALTGWTSLYCRPYGLQYALQALRPEVQKEIYTNFFFWKKKKLVKKKKYASFQAVRPGKMLLQLRPYGLSCKRPGLTAWP